MNLPNKCCNGTRDGAGPFSFPIHSAWIAKSNPLTARFDHPAGANGIIFIKLNDPGPHQPYSRNEELELKMMAESYLQILKRANQSVANAAAKIGDDS